MGRGTFKKFKVVTFEDILGIDEGDDGDDYDDEYGGLKASRRMMSLFTLFGGLKNVFKVKTYSSDTFVFRLHYKVTMGFLLGCSLLITAVQLVSDPITCDVKGVPGGIFNSFCWTHATFTLPYRQKSKDGPKIQPGVGPLKLGSEPQEEARYHGFYQWVGMVLFGQAITFYIPHYIWKTCEGKKVERLVSGISSPVANEDTKKKHKLAIAEYFYCNQRRHVFYGLRFFFCELLNLSNVSLHMYLLDQLLGGEFSTYGLQVLSYVMLDDEERMDPMVKIFPKVTKCTFHNFGASGTIQQYDGLCILPINMVNDKIFIALWFWLLILFSVSCIFMVFRVFTMMSKFFRISLLRAIAPNVSRKTWQFLKIHLGFGDWLILTMMSHHLDIKIFGEILAELKRVSVENSRSVSTTIFEVNGASDTEACDIDKEDAKKLPLRSGPPTPTRSANKIFSQTPNATSNNLLGMDQQLVQNMIADGYDPSEMKAYMGWDKSPLHHIGDSAMIREEESFPGSSQLDSDKEGLEDMQENQDDAMAQHLLEEMLYGDEEEPDDKDDDRDNQN